MVLAFLLALQQESAYAYNIKASWNDIDNLPPYSQIDMSKKRMVDVNVVDDVSSEYGISAVNSKLNAIMKSKFAQNGIDFKVSTISDSYKYIYDEYIGSWEEVGGYSGTAKDGFTGITTLTAAIKNNGSYITWQTGPQWGTLYTALDYSKYIYKVVLKGKRDNEDVAYTKEIYGYDPNHVTLDMGYIGNYTQVEFKVYRALKNIPDKTFKYDSTDDYYPRNYWGYADTTTKNPSGVHGYLKYNLIGDKRIIITNYSVNNYGNANTSSFYIVFYSDYTKTKVIATKSFLNVRTNLATIGSNPENPQGGGILIDFSDIPGDVVAFSIGADISYTYDGVFSTALFKNSDGDLLTAQIGSDYIMRPSFISETINNDSFTWRDGAEKYFIIIGNNDFAENIYSAGKAESLACLIQNGICCVKIGNQALKQDADRLLKDNDGNGRFIDSSNLDIAIQELTDYILGKVDENTDLNSNYVVVSENESHLEFEAGGINFTSGIQELNSTAVRSKDYIPINETGNYTVSSNNSGITSVRIFSYDENVDFMVSFVVNTDSKFTLQQGSAFIKILCPSSTNIKAEKMSLTDNNAFGGDIVNYNPRVTDNENDNSDVVYKFSHDPKKIAGKLITNPSDKLALSGQELSVPISKFTKPGTYIVSMFARDIPKDKTDDASLLSNGDAETVGTDGKPFGWNTSAENESQTKFTTKKSGENNYFEIMSKQAGDGANSSAAYYQDIDISANAKYRLTGNLGSQNCKARFVIYEMDEEYNILKVVNSPELNNQSSPKKITVDFTTGKSTAKLRVHILKGNTINADEGGEICIFANNISLYKMLPDGRFDDYRKKSNDAATVIYAHRLPRADFSYQIQGESGGAFSIKNLADNQLSYDPDHTDKANKGIINSQWRWAEITGDGTAIWHEGKLSDTQIFKKGTQVIIWYRVQDNDGPNGVGAWSLPRVIKTDGSLSESTALFIPNPNPLPMQDKLEITDQSYTPNFGGTIVSREWTIKKDGQSGRTLTFERTDAENNKYYKSFNTMGFGKYTISLTVTDSFGMVSKPYTRTINVIDAIDPTVAVTQMSGTYHEGATVYLECKDSTQGNTNNRGLKSITYVWSKNASAPTSSDMVHTVNVTSEGVYDKQCSTTQTAEGVWYLYAEDEDFAGNTSNNEAYVRYGPYNIEKIKAGHFYVTMMQDVGWRSYYFDLSKGMDDNHDGEADRYSRLSDTDIGTAKLPINYYNLVGYPRTYIKAGYRVKGKIDIEGILDSARFYAKYVVRGRTCVAAINLTHMSGNTYTFEWVIPMDTDDKSFISFDLEMKKENITYGNEKWNDTWDARNTSRQVFYIRGKATEDLIFYQSH